MLVMGKVIIFESFFNAINIILGKTDVAAGLKYWKGRALDMQTDGSPLYIKCHQQMQSKHKLYTQLISNTSIAFILYKCDHCVE